jgi:membrane associated rhomboid family serine protease
MLPLNDPEVPRHRFPFVNYTIIILNFIVFIYMLTLGSTGSDIFIYQYGFIPVGLLQGVSINSAQLSDGSTISFASSIPAWCTLFTSMFVHSGWLHILGNMLYLWVFGDNVEDRFGHIKYVLFYLFAGLAAAFLQTIIDPASDIPNVGASGAIAGVLGAYLVFYPGSRVRTLLFVIIIPFIVKIPAFVLLIIWFVLQFVSGIGSLGAVDAGGVAYFAHVGGFVFGMAVAGIARMVSRPQNEQTPPQI